MHLRPAEGLHLWRGVLLDHVRDSGVDLTIRQLLILLTLYLESPPHTVRGLARYLGVTKPVITRALDTLGRRDLIRRRRDQTDRRNVVILRTVTGSQYVERLASHIIGRAKLL